MAKKKPTASRSAATKASKAAKKPTTKKVVKKTTKKSATKKTTKNKSSGKAVTKKATTKKTTAKKAPTKKKTTKKKTTQSSAKRKTTKTTTKKKTTAGKAAKPAAPTKPSEMTLEEALDRDWTIPQLKRIKTGLSKKDLAYYLQLLLEKRAEIIGNVQGMEDARNASLGDIAHMPLHMADVGSDNFEQEFTLGLMESERTMLREIEEAIVRMREGYYGVCVDSGRPINRDRLEVKPWAKYCIEVARLREKRGW